MLFWQASLVITIRSLHFFCENYPFFSLLQVSLKLYVKYVCVIISNCNMTMRKNIFFFNAAFHVFVFCTLHMITLHSFWRKLFDEFLFLFQPLEHLLNHPTMLQQCLQVLSRCPLQICSLLKFVSLVSCICLRKSNYFSCTALTPIQDNFVNFD